MDTRIYGNNLFLIRSQAGSQHSVQVANSELFLSLNNQGSGDYSLELINDSNSTSVTSLNIYGELFLEVNLAVL